MSYKTESKKERISRIVNDVYYSKPKSQQYALIGIAIAVIALIISASVIAQYGLADNEDPVINDTDDLAIPADTIDSGTTDMPSDSSKIIPPEVPDQSSEYENITYPNNPFLMPPAESGPEFVTVNGRSFELSDNGFVPFGANYVDYNTFSLNPFYSSRGYYTYSILDEFNEEETRIHFRLAKQSGANTIRMFITMNPIISEQAERDSSVIDSIEISDKSQWDKFFDYTGIDKIDKIVDIADENEIKLIFTPLSAEEGVPDWWFFDSLTDERTLKAEELIYRYLADRYQNEEAIMSWSMINEPVAPFVIVDDEHVKLWNEWIERKYENQENLESVWDDFGKSTVTINSYDFAEEALVKPEYYVYYNGFVDFDNVEKVVSNGEEISYIKDGKGKRIWSSTIFIADNNAMFLSQDDVSTDKEFTIFLNKEEWGSLLPPDNVNSGSQRLADYQKFREYLASRWTERMSNAVREEDSNHLVTVGLVQYSTYLHPFSHPSEYAGFNANNIGKYFDYISIHAYMTDIFENRNDFMNFVIQFISESSHGKPVVVEEFGEIFTVDTDENEYIIFTSSGTADFNNLFVESTIGSANGWIVWSLFDFDYHLNDVIISTESGIYTKLGQMTEWGEKFISYSNSIA